MILAAASFLLLIVLPVDFSYTWFALILLLNGIGMGLFSSPNSAGVMNALPPTQRGAGAGMLATFMNTRQRALDRRLLHADDRRALVRPAARAAERTARARRARRRRGARLAPAAGRDALFFVPRLQPDGDAARPARPPRTAGRTGARADRAQLLPAPDLGPVPHRARLRLRLRDRRLPRRRGRLAAARRQVPLRRGDLAGGGADRDSNRSSPSGRRRHDARRPTSAATGSARSPSASV